MTLSQSMTTQGQDQPPTYAMSVGSDSQENIAQPSKAKPGKFSRHFHSISSKAGYPLNKAANMIGGEGWWPTSMEKECRKAARILHSFTGNTSLSDSRREKSVQLTALDLKTAIPPSSNGPMHPIGITRKSMVKIPQDVLQKCAGLAIFNVLRVGAMHGSLAAGSGVVIARRSDGTWSPPSSFVVTTLGAGFAVGLNVYDSVCVLNTREQVEAFTYPRVSLGGDASIAVGPVGTGANVDAALSKTARPIFSYMKSRGLFAGVQIDGTVIVTRADANAVFYDERGISAKKILLSDQMVWPHGAEPLFEVLKALDGRQDYDTTVIQQVANVPPPGDAIVSDEKEALRVIQTEVSEEEADIYEKHDKAADSKN